MQGTTGWGGVGARPEARPRGGHHRDSGDRRAPRAAGRSSLHCTLREAAGLADRRVGADSQNCLQDSSRLSRA